MKLLANTVCRKISLTFFVPCLVISSYIAPAEPPETFVHALTRLGIHIDKPSLIAALNNPNKKIRGLAAAQLAEMKATDTLPAILYAARTEADPLEQVNIAAAATWMGSTEGMLILTRICREATLPFYTRQNAARVAISQGDRTCYAALEDMMMQSAETESRIGAMYLLTQLNNKTRTQSDNILGLILPMLGNSEMRIRLEATQGLLMLKNPDAIGPLKAALSKEPEDIVRKQMQYTLEALTKPPL